MQKVLLDKYNQYPVDVREKLMFLRQLILETANELPEVSVIEETLKWGELAFVSPVGSTLRIDWKSTKPNQYAIYFNCKTKLVATFRELYRCEVMFEGNRALVLPRYGELPVAILKHCISLALRYKKIKHLPLLGA